MLAPKCKQLPLTKGYPCPITIVNGNKIVPHPEPDWPWRERLGRGILRVRPLIAPQTRLQLSFTTMQLTASFLLLVATVSVYAQPSSRSSEVQTVYPDAQAFYLDLHQNPELSSHEVQTASKLAGHLRDLGYEVTEHVGGTGVVAVLKNGTGPTVMFRTELDALPVEEKTGLAYASKIRTKDDIGRDVAVMHACGHDVHMASLFGAAAIMVHSKDSWHGTLILIGQPAEETIAGAKRMVEDGLMSRFPKPDFALALHVGNELPAGQVGVGPGYRFSN